MRTISQMVALYCARVHAGRERGHEALCGERLCEECAALEAYALERTRKCARMEEKTTCDRCELHCYEPERLEEIRAVMRFSGPRMLFAHPIAAFRHLIGS